MVKRRAIDAFWLCVPGLPAVHWPWLAVALSMAFDIVSNRFSNPIWYV